MFSDDDRELRAKCGRAMLSSRQAPPELTNDEMVKQLQETGRYRILRKLEPRAVAEIIRPEFSLRGVILDTETTGLDHRKDEIIEIA